MPTAGTWIKAFRLRTLPLALSSILMGTFLAIAKGHFDGLVFSLGIITTIFLQVLSNLANDYGDAASGVDGTDRGGPQRTVQSGMISKEEMKRALYLLTGLSLVSGLSLISVALGDQWKLGILFLILGIAGIIAAFKYTMGKNPYGYSGFGDLFVLIFFGFVGVVGSNFLLTGTFDAMILFPATSTGLLAVAVLNVNNIRDIESDQKNGKYSIPVRIGKRNAVLYHWVLLSLSVSSSVVYVSFINVGFTSWLFIAVLPLIFINARAVFVKTKPNELDPYLKQMAITTLLYVLLFGLGQIQF